MPEKLPNAAPSSRKRKQAPSSTSSMQELPNSSSSNSTPPYQQPQQSTITDHFSPRGQREQLSSANILPPVKRSKSSGSSSDSVKKEKQKGNMRPVTEATMMDFGTAIAPVDLTSSSPIASPVRPAGPPPAAPSTGVKTPAKPTVQQSGPRKLRIKNLRPSNESSATGYTQTTWKSLDVALKAIYAREKIPMSLEELYRGVENVCRAGGAHELHQQLLKSCDDYFSKELKPKIVQNVGAANIEVTRELIVNWTQWEKQLNTIRSIFLYLDRSHLFAVPSRQSLEAMGLQLFRKYIAEDAVLGKRFVSGALELYDQDRYSGGSESISSELLTSSIRMLTHLGLYSDKFDKEFIIASKLWWARIADESSKNDLKTYLAMCARQMELERARCDRFHLAITTKRESMRVLEDEMIRKKVPLLTDKDQVTRLLVNCDFGSLQTLYQLLDLVKDPGVELKPAWESYICDEGSKIIRDPKTELMVPRLLDFKGTLDAIWIGPLQKNTLIEYALRDSFSLFINKREEGASMKDNSKPAEMVAKYVDMLLRQGARGLPPVAGAINPDMARDEDVALAYRLELVLDLFRFIQGKDVFEAFYKKDLARRLLLGRSASVDAEGLMLTKLKTECGSGFTNNLEAMFKDMDLSKESVKAFKLSKLGTEKALQHDIHVSILSQAAWPTYPEVPVNIPPHLAEHMEAFAQFYVSKHKGRKLTWRHALSHCVLKADFPKGKKDLLLSAFQAVVLLSFNEAPASGILTYKDLSSSTGLSDPELQRTLQSLALGKLRVLIKSPKGRDIVPTDKFIVNASFESPQIRVKINQVQLKETPQENKETHERVEQDRQYETQAAIIRIMKARRNIRHVELVQQVIEQTRNRGTLDVGLIKKNIDRLIEKEYMDRSDNDMYVYVA